MYTGRSGGTLKLYDFDEDGDGDGDGDGDDNIGPKSASSPTSSRARMLAQQRDIQLKKRQNNMQGGGTALITSQ